MKANQKDCLKLVFIALIPIFYIGLFYMNIKPNTTGMVSLKFLWFGHIFVVEFTNAMFDKSEIL